MEHAFSHRPWHVGRPDYAQMARDDRGYDPPPDAVYRLSDRHLTPSPIRLPRMRWTRVTFTGEMQAATETKPSANAAPSGPAWSPESGNDQGEVQCA